MNHRRVNLVLLAAAFVLTLHTVPAAAQGLRAIGGTLRDAPSPVLPGASVSLTSAGGTIGGNQETLSDVRGTYQFTRLVPGRYSVKTELTGFRPAVQDGIVVDADATTRVDLKLEVGQLEEGIIVKGESPLIDTTSALNQTVLSREDRKSTRLN